MIIKMVSGLVASAIFRRKVTLRIRRLVRRYGRDGHFEKVSRPPNVILRGFDKFEGRGGPDHFVLDTRIGGRTSVRLSANLRPFYKNDVLASVEMDGKLVYMSTKANGVEMMVNPVLWFRVIDEIEERL